MIIDKLEAAMKEGDPQRVEVNLANGSLFNPIERSVGLGKHGLPAVAKNIRTCWPSDTAREKSSMAHQVIGKSSTLVESLWRLLCKLSNRISRIVEKNREFANVPFFHHVQNAMLK
jgi:hypothetical protein